MPGPETQKRCTLGKPRTNEALASSWPQAGPSNGEGKAPQSSRELAHRYIFTPPPKLTGSCSVRWRHDKVGCSHLNKVALCRALSRSPV